MFAAGAVAATATLVQVTGASALPAPGTAAQVAKLVASSSGITRLSSTLRKELATATNDSPGKVFPSTYDSCTTMTSCDFGYKYATKSVILLGDSHAQMWLPAMNRIGLAGKYKVILLFMPQCPAATLAVWSSYAKSPYIQCSVTRSAWISQIVKMRPMAVLLAERTYGVYSTASGGTKTFTDSQWQAGLTATIKALKPSGAKIAVIGDIVTFSTPVPSCLAAEPNHVQRCAVPNPNPLRPNRASAERAAAASERVLFVDPTQWLCTKSCSPVIGNFIAYYDQFHASASYVGYLSSVLQSSLAAVL